MLLAILPCTDGLTSCMIDQVLEDIASISGVDSQQTYDDLQATTDEEHQHADHCSPFCICVCCGISLDQGQTIITLGNNYLLLQIITILFIDIKGIFLPYKTWRPPRMS